MLIITILQRSQDHVCTWNGTTYRGTSLTDLARKLKAADCPNQPWRSRWDNGEPSMKGPNLDWLAAHVLTTNRGRYHWARYYAPPSHDLAPQEAVEGQGGVERPTEATRRPAG